MCKKISVYVLSAIILFLSISNCYVLDVQAATFITDLYEDLKNINEIIGVDDSVAPAQMRETLYKTLLYNGQINAPASNLLEIGTEQVRKWYVNYMNKKYGTSITDVTSDQIDETNRDFINNIDISVDNQVTFNDNSRQMILDLADIIEQDSVSYLYSYTLSEFGSARNVPTGIYLKLQEVISVASDLSNTIFIVQGTGSNISYASIDLSSVPYLYARRTSASGIHYSCQLYNGYDNTLYNSSFGKWNATNGDFSSDGGATASIVGFVDNGVTSTTPPATFGGGSPCFVSREVRKSLRVFTSVPSATDIMYAPYYYNNSVWQDFSTSSGDYTLTNSNINTITYGDTTSYIDSFNETEGHPPTIYNIDKWIENKNIENTTPTPTPTPTGTPGDGGGSGGDDDSGTGIFDILKNLGKIIADFIKGIGAAITEILSAITEIISSIASDLPTAITGLFEIVFGFLPAEWRAIIGLGITAMIIIGLFKVIRGG